MDLRQERVAVKAKQGMTESQINCLKYLNYLQEDLQVLKLKMIIYFVKEHLMIQEDLPILINLLILHLKPVLAMLMLKIKELLINLYQESIKLPEQEELEQASVSEVMNLSNLQLMKVFLLHFQVWVQLSEVFPIFFQNLIQLASFLIKTAFQKIHLLMVVSHPTLSIFFL